jgi:hypothetical protein
MRLGLNSSLIAGLLFLYVFLVQVLPLDPASHFAAQLSVGVAGVAVALRLAKLERRRALPLFLPVLAGFSALLIVGSGPGFAFFAGYVALVIVALALTWVMRRR